MSPTINTGEWNKKSQWVHIKYIFEKDNEDQVPYQIK